MLKYIRRRVRRVHTDTSGAMSIEKILIVGIIALPILIALVTFRNTIKGWFQSNVTQLQNQNQADPGGSSGG